MQNSTLAPGKVIVSAMLDEAQRDHLLRLAREADRSLSAEIRRALVAHLDRKPTPEETAA